MRDDGALRVRLEAIDADFLDVHNSILCLVFVSSPPTLCCFVAVVVGRYKQSARHNSATTFSEGDFSPNGTVLFLFRVLCIQKDDVITTAHGVIMSFARKTNNLRRESREKGGRLFRRYLSRADGKKINTTYSLFELEEHMLEAEIIQLITFAAALHVCNNLYYVTND